MTCPCGKIFKKKKSFTNHYRWCSSNKKYFKFRKSVSNKISQHMKNNNPQNRKEVRIKTSKNISKLWKEGFYNNRKKVPSYLNILNKKDNPQKKDYNRKRMKENNPMFNTKTINKMTNTMHQNGEYKKTSERLIKNPIGKYIKNPSKPQLDLFYQVQQQYQNKVFLNYRIKKPNGRSYFLDIAIPSKMLNVEYDGWRHTLEENKLKDKVRDKYLKTLGWNIIRISD